MDLSSAPPLDLQHRVSLLALNGTVRSSRSTSIAGIDAGLPRGFPATTLASLSTAKLERSSKFTLNPSPRGGLGDHGMQEVLLRRALVGVTPFCVATQPFVRRVPSI